MAYRQVDLGLLVRLQPDEAATKILNAYRDAEGNATRVAELLQVDRRTLSRWVEQLEATTNIRDRIDAIRDARKDRRSSPGTRASQQPEAAAG